MRARNVIIDMKTHFHFIYGYSTEYYVRLCLFFFGILCCWQVIRKLGIVRFDEISKLEISFSSSCLCPLLLAVYVCTLKKKKIGIGCVNIRKFVNSTHTKWLFLWETKKIKFVNLMENYSSRWRESLLLHVFVCI